MEPTISVVVPVYNGGKTIRATIEQLLTQSIKPDEIIVVDDGSTDDTPDILKSFGNQIKVLSKTKGGPASARNAGIRASSSALIAFTDSDCFPAQDWLEQIVKGFHSLSVVGVGGIVCGVSDGLIAEYVDLHGWMNPHCAGGNVLYLVTANACVRSDALNRANLFDERPRSGQRILNFPSGYATQALSLFCSVGGAASAQTDSSEYLRARESW